MKTFTCQCGQGLFFESSLCQQCGRFIGFDHSSMQLYTSDSQQGENWYDQSGNASVIQFKLCKNSIDFNNCNWLVNSPHLDYCYSCSLNQVIPNLMQAKNLSRWSKIEAFKRRLLFTLLTLRLDVSVTTETHPETMKFAFLEDQRSNANVSEVHVSTGHYQGLITLNVVEADDEYLEETRKRLNEPYRTVLGHFRHESGHFFFDRLIPNSAFIDQFREVFGDERQDYESALNAYYKNEDLDNWNSKYISKYAQAHPLEDWAETWAHYLHIVDTAETAQWVGLIRHHIEVFEGNEFLTDWQRLVVILNELNRSMGHKDAYPFVLNSAVLNKLQFIHQIVKFSTN